MDALDPRSAIATLEFHFEQENFDQDRDGDNGAQAKRRAAAMLSRFKQSRASAEADMVMDLENRAVHAVEKAAKLKKTDNGSYAESDDALVVGFSVNSVGDVQRLRDLFDREGRSYDFGPYMTVSGLMLFPQGYNGPRYGVESSYERGKDLDEWLGAMRPARARSSVAKASSKRRPARKANEAPRRTRLACTRRSAGLKAGSSSSARLLRSHCPDPGASRRKAAAKRAAQADMARRRASLTAAEREAVLAFFGDDARARKPALAKRGRAGTLRGTLASAYEKLGPGGVFAFPLR